MLPFNLGGKLIKIVFTPWRLFTPEGRKKINQNFFEDVKDDFNRNVELVQKVSSFSGEFKENFDKGRNMVRNPFSTSGSGSGAGSNSSSKNFTNGNHLGAIEKVKGLEFDLALRKERYEEFKRGSLSEPDWDPGFYKRMVDDTQKELDDWRQKVKWHEEQAAIQAKIINARDQ